jgi:hypothetical protein
MIRLTIRVYGGSPSIEAGVRVEPDHSPAFIAHDAMTSLINSSGFFIKIV